MACIRDSGKGNPSSAASHSPCILPTSGSQHIWIAHAHTFNSLSAFPRDAQSYLDYSNILISLSLHAFSSHCFCSDEA